MFCLPFVVYNIQLGKALELITFTRCFMSVKAIIFGSSFGFILLEKTFALTAQANIFTRRRLWKMSCLQSSTVSSALCVEKCASSRTELLSVWGALETSLKKSSAEKAARICQIVSIGTGAVALASAGFAVLKAFLGGAA